MAEKTKINKKNKKNKSGAGKSEDLRSLEEETKMIGKVIMHSKCLCLWFLLWSKKKKKKQKKIRS